VEVQHVAHKEKEDQIVNLVRFIFNSIDLFWFYFFLKWINLGIYCGWGNEGNADWPTTLATGDLIDANCLSGYYGSVSRVCYDYHEYSGSWSQIFGSCNGAISISLFFHPAYFWSLQILNPENK